MEFIYKMVTLKCYIFIFVLAGENPVVLCFLCHSPGHGKKLCSKLKFEVPWHANFITLFGFGFQFSVWAHCFVFAFCCCWMQIKRDTML